MIDYCSLALDYLGLAFDPQQAQFSYSSRLDPDGRVVNDFRRPESLRYTINTYLGLAEAERHGASPNWLGGSVVERVRAFLALHENELTSPADRGLLLVLLAAVDPAHPAVDRSLRAVAGALGGPQRLTLNLQDLAWMLWGATAHPEDAAARELADRTFEFIRVRYSTPSGLPRHSLARYRSHIVSFGSLVYYLRALHEYGSPQARELLEAALSRTLALQDDDGAWPWMIDVRTAIPFDRYPVFTVHQDSMAMLFLFAAAQEQADATKAIERSLRWNLGANELGAPMVLTEPHPWIYRSIERVERAPADPALPAQRRAGAEGRPAPPLASAAPAHQPRVPLLPPRLGPLRLVGPGPSRAARPDPSMSPAVWIDIENPPQVQYLLPFRRAFAQAGLDTVITTRDHDATLQMLKDAGVTAHPFGTVAPRAKHKKLTATARRARDLARFVKRTGRPVAQLGASRAAVIAAWRLRVPELRDHRLRARLPQGSTA